MTPMRYLPGDGHEYVVWVRYLADVPVGFRSLCAFCHGDACAERGLGMIALHRKRLGKYFETCPMCNGRPS